MSCSRGVINGDTNGSIYPSFCIFTLMPILDYMEDAYGVTGKLKLAIELLQRILGNFLREAIRHVLVCVLCQISLRVACRSQKLSSGFQLNLLQTLSVCPEGSALMKTHQRHTIEALLLTAVSISPIKLL